MNNASHNGPPNVSLATATIIDSLITFDVENRIAVSAVSIISTGETDGETDRRFPYINSRTDGHGRYGYPLNFSKERCQRKEERAQNWIKIFSGIIKKEKKKEKERKMKGL